jgi:hypothetical protein
LTQGEIDGPDWLLMAALVDALTKGVINLDSFQNIVWILWGVEETGYICGLGSLIN